MTEFRTAITPAPTSTSSEPAKPELADKPIDSGLAYTYADEYGHPLSADYFDVSNIWDKSPNMKWELESVESFLKEQIKAKKLANSSKAAKQYLKSLEKEAHISPLADYNTRISDLLAFIDFKRTVNGSTTTI